MQPLHVLGIALLVWVARDLVAGNAYLHRRFSRTIEPAGYWTAITAWLAVALSCFHSLLY